VVVVVAYLSIYLSIIYLSIYLSFFLRAWKQSYSARLSQFLTWQRQKRNNSARLPQFEVDNIKNETILRDVLQRWKVECRADGLVPVRFAIFQKSDARSYEVLHLPHKIILANLKIWCSKMQPTLRKSAPWPPNISDGHFSCTAPATRNSSFQLLFKCRMPAIVFGNATAPYP